jgi:hypothetical protein
MNDVQLRIWKGTVLAHLRYNPSIRLEALKKNYENFQSGWPVEIVTRCDQNTVLPLHQNVPVSVL